MKGKRCPGETECRKGGDPLYLLWKPSAGEKDEATGQNSAAMICPNCPLFDTKPGREPIHVTAAINFAMEHEESIEGGLRLNSLDQLNPMQWAAYRGLSRGRSKFEEWRYEQMESDRDN
jgi:hypothetical protein